VALSPKMTCNLRHPVGLRHPSRVRVSRQSCHLCVYGTATVVGPKLLGLFVKKKKKSICKSLLMTKMLAIRLHIVVNIAHILFHFNTILQACQLTAVNHAQTIHIYMYMNVYMYICV